MIPIFIQTAPFWPSSPSPQHPGSFMSRGGVSVRYFSVEGGHKWAIYVWSAARNADATVREQKYCQAWLIFNGNCKVLKSTS